MGRPPPEGAGVAYVLSRIYRYREARYSTTMCTMRIIVRFVWVPTAALLLSLLSAPFAHAVMVNWKADVDGAFNDATKWSTGKAPGANDDAVDNFVNHEIKSTVNTKVKSFTTKGGFDLAKGTFEATNGITSSGGFGLNGGTIKDTVVTISGGRFSISNSDNSVLNGVTFKGIGTDILNQSGGTVTVRKGLTLQPIMRFDNGSKMAFAGSQVFAEGALSFEGAARNAIKMTDGTDLTIGTAASPTNLFPGKVTVIRGNAANAVIGEKSSDPMKTNTIKVVGELSLSGDDYTIAANRFINEGKVSVFNGQPLKLQSDEFHNKKNATFNALGSLSIATSKFTNDGTWVGGKKVEISADKFQNAGSLTVNIGDDLTVKGQKVGSATNTGTVFVDAAGKLSFQSGYRQTAGSTKIDGNVTIERNGNKTNGIFAGGTLSGSGKVNGNVVSRGFTTIKPGDSPGILSIDGDFRQRQGLLDIEIGGTILGSEYSQLQISDLSRLINGDLEADLINGFVPSFGDAFVILTASNVQGIFVNAPDTLAVNGGVFDVIYTPTSVILTNFTTAGPVPEPSTWLLLGSGLIGLVMWRRYAHA